MPVDLIGYHIATIHQLRGILLLRKADPQVGGSTSLDDILLARLDLLEAHVAGKSVDQIQQEVATMVVGLALTQTREEEE